MLLLVNGATKQEDFQAATASGSTSSWMRFLTTREVIDTWTWMNAAYTLDEARTADSREEISGRKQRICCISSSGRLSRKELEDILLLFSVLSRFFSRSCYRGREKRNQVEREMMAALTSYNQTRQEFSAAVTSSALHLYAIYVYIYGVYLYIYKEVNLHPTKKPP